MDVKKILVTGSSGTIGTRLVETLLNLNKYTVVGVDKKENKWNSDLNEITVLGDLRNEETFEKLPKDIDLIIHLAANARVYDLIEDPPLALENVESLFNTLEFVRKNEIKKIIFASSREVYGGILGIQSENEVKIENSESPYTFSKISGEALINSYGKCYDVDFLVLRLANVYGRYDDKDRIIPLFIKKCNKNESLTIFGKDKILDFIHIDDIITALIKSIENFEEVKNNTINIASGEGTSLLKLAQLIRKFLGKEVKIILKENRKGEVVKSILDISKAKTELGFEAKIEIEEGLKKTVKWYLENFNESPS